MARIDRLIRKREPAPAQPLTTWTAARLGAEYERLLLLPSSWKIFKEMSDILHEQDRRERITCHG